MARGGARPGAGRPRKSPSAEAGARLKAAVSGAKANKAAAAPRDAAEVVSRYALSPLDYLLGVVNDTSADAADRMRAAQAAAPFVHMRPSEAATVEGKKEQRRKAAEEAATGRFAPRVAPRLAVDNG